MSVLWQTVTGLLGAFAKAIWVNLPAILEIKKVVGYFTPAGIIALMLGVPTIFISILLFAIKKLVRDKV